VTSSLDPRDEILDVMERIYRYRMTTTSGGNLSIRGDGGTVWITPAAVDKGSLRRSDIVRVGADGVVDGHRPPSSELPLHRAVYRARPDVRGILHAHPVALVAFSLVHAVPDTRLLHQSRQVCGEGGFARYELPGSTALGESVAGAFAGGHDCVILENHGVATAGTSLQEAFRRFETFEFTARTIIRTRALGREPVYLDDEELALADRMRADLPVSAARLPEAGENELGALLCEFVRRAYRQRLFTSTQGSFSVRTGPSSFLITPYGIDRGAVTPAELVAVSAGRAAPGSHPSRAARLHAAIYRQRPELGAIVNAYPINATAFGVCGAELDTRTIPESYIVVRKPGRAPFGRQFADPEGVANLLSRDCVALLLENNGVLVAGSDILQAFDRLEVLESTAQALIDARGIGSLVPMTDAALSELDAVFFPCD
jgi:L-fuculose-phosphate aldolase